MAKTTAKYECVYIIDVAPGEDAVNAVLAKFREMLEANSKVEKIDEWGKRRLAYPINDLTEGYYVCALFESAPSFPQELDRVFKITDGILRSMIICIEE